MFWLWLRLNGCEARSNQNGWSVMDIVLKSVVCPLQRRSANNSCIKWARMGGNCWLPSSQIPKTAGCSPSQQLLPGSGCGSKTISLLKKGGRGFLTKTYYNQQNSLFPLLISLQPQPRTAKP